MAKILRASGVELLTASDLAAGQRAGGEVMTCYVCGKVIEPKAVKPEKYEAKTMNTFITAGRDGLWYRRIDLPVYVGNDTFRHDACTPGGAKWIALEKRKKRRKQSELLPYFLLGQKKADE